MTVAQVNQSLRPDLPIGSWESSGIIDASSAFGPGSFLVDIQAHGYEIETAPSPFPGITYMREAGQLLAVQGSRFVEAGVSGRGRPARSRA